MNSLVELTERPVALETFMIAGWHQWADAGAISSGLVGAPHSDRMPCCTCSNRPGL